MKATLAESANQILAIGTLFLGAHFGGKASRAMGTGEVTGYILGGVLVGPKVMSLMGADTAGYAGAFDSFNFFTFLFLSLIAFSLGEELHFDKFAKVGRTALLISITQGIATWALISGVFYFMGFGVLNSLLIGSIGTATAPAAIFILMNRLTIEGRFRELLANIVVIADVFEIFVFALLTEIALSIKSGSGTTSMAVALFEHIGLALFLGFVLFLLLKWVVRFEEVPAEDQARTQTVRRDSGLDFISSIFQESPAVSTDLMIVILAFLAINVGFSLKIQLPFLLVALMAGVCISNFHTHTLFKSLQIDPITRVMNLFFFGLIGATMDFSVFTRESAMLIAAYVAARAAGKFFGTWVGAKMAGCDPKILSCLPRMLLPQGGVAMVEVTFLAMVLGEDGQKIFAVVLPSVVIFEIAGILLSERTLLRWKAWTVGEKEALEGSLDHDLPANLVDFLEISAIRLPLVTRDKEDVIRELVSSFELQDTLQDKEIIVRAVLEREKLLNTALGHGVAMPHCRCSAMTSPRIALGTIPGGADFGAHDGVPVNLVFLLVSPEEPPELHLKALAMLSRLLMNSANREMICRHRDPMALYEALENLDLSI